jgi:hypothetical protein
MTAAKKIDQLIAKVGDWRGERLAEIRALIREVDPDVVEEWKWMGTPLDGGKWRAIDFFEGDTIDKPALKALLRQAVAYNVKHSVPKSKGSRKSLL